MAGFVGAASRDKQPIWPEQKLGRWQRAQRSLSVRTPLLLIGVRHGPCITDERRRRGKGCQKYRALNCQISSGESHWLKTGWSGEADDAIWPIGQRLRRATESSPDCGLRQFNQ